MDLTTRCPSCGTVFKAGLQELQLRKGYIRCVQCSHIFDGYAEVVSESGSSAAANNRPAPSLGRTEPSRVTAQPSPVIAQTPQVFRASRGSREEPHVPVSLSLGEHRPEPSIGGDVKDGRAHAAERIIISPASPSIASKPEPFVVEPHPTRAGGGGSAAPLMRAEDEDGAFSSLGRIVGGIVLALLILLALGQLAYIYRSQVALAVPAVRPVIEQACALLRCKVPYARDLSSLSISGSALREVAQVPQVADDGADTGATQAATRHYLLNATLRNLADLPQEWPTMVLDLNDASGARLVRRNLSPHDYLTPEQLAGPFAARGDVLVRVPLSVTGIEVNGYQLDLFFP